MSGGSGGGSAAPLNAPPFVPLHLISKYHLYHTLVSRTCSSLWCYTGPACSHDELLLQPLLLASQRLSTFILFLKILFAPMYSSFALAFAVSVHLLLTAAFIVFLFVIFNVFVKIHPSWLRFVGPSTSWHVDVTTSFTLCHLP